ncbi:hypothetical protein, partial [Citrobacter meridianamericanus]
VNDGCFITCTVTVNAHAQDIDGNPLSGLSVGSQSPTYGGGSTGFTLPPTDASGNAAIQRPMTTAAVDTGVYVFADAAHNAGVIPATRAGTFTSEYRSATTTVTTSVPYTRVIWTYVDSTNTLRSAATPDVYKDVWVWDIDDLCVKYDVDGNCLRYATVGNTAYGHYESVLVSSGSPATYWYTPTKWDCRSDVNPSGSAPGALPANCTNISPAPSVVTNQTNPSPGWTHSP